VRPPLGIKQADCLNFMAGLPDGACDLIYVDPPFDTDRPFGDTVPTSPRDAHPASPGAAAARSLADYLAFLRPRLAEMRRLLSTRGSLFVHLDWRCVHYVRVMLDELFGEHCFLNEIIWHYRSGGRPGRWLQRKHDTILYYVRSPGEHTFHVQRDGAYRTDGLKVDEAGRPYKNTQRGKLYFHADGPAMTDVWDVPFLSTVSNERTGYPTQKPEALLERVVRIASNPGDLVADFFCGSGTTLAVAQRLGRRWLGCDVSDRAVEIARARLAAVPAEGLP
jgi:DNA modification methylase